MSETHGEQEDNTQAEVQPVTSGEDGVHSKEAEAVSSPPDEKDGEKPTASERDDEEGKSQVNEKPGESPKEEETTAKPVAKQPRQLRCFDPAGTVDIAMGRSGVEARKPVTVAHFFQQSFDQLPNHPALCWKNKKEDPWQSLTYTEYKKLIYNVAKSFLKVMYY